ncbi:MAG: glycosyltransferase family 4 protein [Candidatus Hodarchaeota archaeon]
MKIIEVSPRFPPSKGGVESHTFHLSVILKKMGYDVEVFTTYPNMGITVNEKINGISVTRFPSFAPFDILFYSRSLTKILSQAQVDLVHAHGYMSLPMLSAAFAKRKAISNFKLIVTTHLGFSKLGRVPYFFYNPIFGKLIFNEADKIILVSEKEILRLPFLKRHRNKIEVIPNGIQTSDEHFENIYHKKPLHGLKIICVGRLEKNKGFDKAIRIIKKLQDIDVTLDLVGEGPYLDKLFTLVKSLSLTDRIKFHGKLDDGFLNKLYSQAHVLLLLSKYESFGIVLIEAMNAGVVPIATSVGGVPDTLDRNSGFLVDFPVKEDKIATIIKTLSNDRTLLKQMAFEGMQRVRREFDINRIVAEIVQVYENTLNS